MIPKVLLILSVVMVGYIYLGYPLLIIMAGKLRGKAIKKSTITPLVTIVIAAYNEEKAIGATLENKLSLDFPMENLEIIVISDGSTDKTEEIVEGYKDKGVKLLRQVPRAGKTAALNMAVPGAKGEIIVFSDANSLYEKNALRALVRNFADSSIGYVTGKMVYTNPDGSGVGDGCSTYMKYENFLRRHETSAGSVVGVDGGVDAIRKSLYQPMSPDQLPDFVLPLKVVRQGYRVVYEPEAILREQALSDAKDEYKMRVRVSLRALWALWDMRRLLFFCKSPLFAWQLWSHKVLRYLSFVFLSGAYVSTALLWTNGPFYQVLLIIQTLLWAGGIPSVVRGLQGRGLPSKAVYTLTYFSLVNLAAGHAFLKFLRGEKLVVWSPRKG